MQQCNAWTATVVGLADRALAMAEDASPHAARRGEARVSLLELRPVLRRLVSGEPAEAEASAVWARMVEASGAERVRYVDGMGHSRAVYGLLTAWVLRRAGVDVETPIGVDAAEGDPSLRLWSALLDGDGAAGVVGEVLAQPGRGGALHVLGHEDLLDAWTYRELASIHALDLLARRSGEALWRERVREAMVFHQGHTQPDYTTYQPWGLAAFLLEPETAWFGQQQLHDVETHLSVEGGPGAAVVAVLLADAVLTLREAESEGSSS